MEDSKVEVVALPSSVIGTSFEDRRSHTERQYFGRLKERVRGGWEKLTEAKPILPEPDKVGIAENSGYAQLIKRYQDSQKPDDQNNARDLIELYPAFVGYLGLVKVKDIQDQSIFEKVRLKLDEGDKVVIYKLLSGLRARMETKGKLYAHGQILKSEWDPLHNLTYATNRLDKRLRIELDQQFSEYPDLAMSRATLRKADWQTVLNNDDMLKAYLKSNSPLSQK